MNTYGERVKVTIFGESHGPAIGVVLDGVPAGERIDMDAVRIQMRRRAPGSSDLTTHRSETDDPLVMSGILNGVTTGAPISAIFRNKDQNSAAYHPEIPRPSHADYAATVRFGGHADLRGGGPFSGRLTACLVFAGAVCRQILERRGITITANAVRVGQATGKELNFDMKRAILDARSAGDSVGSELECVVTGVPPRRGGGCPPPPIPDVLENDTHVRQTIPAGDRYGAASRHSGRPAGTSPGRRSGLVGSRRHPRPGHAACRLAANLPARRVP